MLTHFVVLPNYHEEDSVFREAFIHLGCSPWAEKHVRIGVGHGRLREPEHSRQK